MLFKLWISCLILFLICLYSVTIPIRIKAKKMFTKEELNTWKKSRSGGKYAWFIYAIFILTPILNVIIGIAIGFLKEELEYQTFKEIRKVNGKQTISDKIDDIVDNVLNIRQ